MTLISAARGATAAAPQSRRRVRSAAAAAAAASARARTLQTGTGTGTVSARRFSGARSAGIETRPAVPVVRRFGDDGRGHPLGMAHPAAPLTQTAHCQKNKTIQISFADI